MLALVMAAVIIFPVFIVGLLALWVWITTSRPAPGWDSWDEEIDTELMSQVQPQATTKISTIPKKEKVVWN